MSDNSLERQIQKMMEGLEFKPEAAVWEKVKAEIAPEKKRRIFGWKLPLLLLLLAGAGTGTWMLWNNNNTPSVITQQIEIYDIDSSDANMGPDNNTPAGASREIVNQSADAPKSIEDEVATQTKKTLTAGNATTGDKQGTITPESVAVKQQQTARNNSTANRNNTGNQPLSLSSNTLEERLLLPFTVETNIAYSQAPAEMATLKLTKKQQQELNRPALNSPVITIPPPAEKNSKWRFMPFVGGGITKINGDDDGGLSSYEKSTYASQSPSFADNSGQPIAVRAVVSYKAKLKSGTTYNAGILAEHPLIGKLSLQTGLRYQYVSYSTLSVINTDSISRMSTGYASVTNTNISGNVNYRMHYLGIPVLLHYNLTQPVGITAGIFNDFIVGANKDGNSLQGAMRKWTPNAYFAFVVNIPGSDKWQWKIMPYIQYGLKSLSNSGNQRLIQPGLQLSLQFNNK